MAQRWTCWHVGDTVERRDDADPARFAAERGDGYRLLHIVDPDPVEFGRVAASLGLNGFVAADAVRPHHRSKFDRYGDTTVFVVKTLWYVSETSDVETGDVVLIVTGDVIVLVRHGDRDPLDDALRDLDDDERLLRLGAHGMVYAIMRAVTRAYASVYAELDDDIASVERLVLSSDRVDMVSRIYSLYREALEFRDAVGPLLPVAEDVLDRRLLRDRPASPYFRSVAHDVKRVATGSDASLHLLHSILDAHLGQISMWQNEDMRKISAWAAIIAAPTMIAGVYGMNFKHMPELNWLLGYPLALVVMATACLLLYRGFRRNGWL